MKFRRRQAPFWKFTKRHPVPFRKGAWRRLVFPFGFSLVLLFNFGCNKTWDILSESERATLHRVLAHWETWMPAEKAGGSAPLAAFKELYAGLDDEAGKFLDRVRAINPKKSFGFRGDYLGTSSEGISFKRIENQPVQKNGSAEKLDPQYLPEEVYEAYGRMMQEMERDLGKKLLVESGYRSPAYQLYTFLYYLPKHGYSLVETGHWIALPGYSEHGAPRRQAIDFINEAGINGEDRVEDFEALPEYGWLLKNAASYGFELSYPRGKKGITFEPWHWRYENPKSSRNL